MKGSLLVGQSGGPTSVINASLAGVIKEAFKHEEITHVYGAINGLNGIINENLYEFSKDTDLDLLSKTPAAALGSVRFKLFDDQTEEIYEIIRQVFIKYDIKYFFYIGGNDSMDTCNKIADYFTAINMDVKVIGIPKTIDNDLVITDHTPGYGSACKYVATTISEIYEDTHVYKNGRVTIVEIMGRDAGWLTASSSLARTINEGPDLIYLPESPFELEDFLNDVDRIYKQNKKVLVAVSEGIRDKNNEYILKYRTFSNSDNFGHMQLGGVAEVLAEIVNKRLGHSVRAIELNLPQRCASHIASKTDYTEAMKCGEAGVKYALKGYTDKMIIMKRVSEYKIKYDVTSLDSVANYVKEFPKEWIINGNSISSEYIKYALPLIKGESSPKFKDGLPLHFKLK